MASSPPTATGQHGARWTLAQIAAACPWLHTTTLASLSNLLQRLRVSWRRGRSHVHSPDPDYLDKTAVAQQLHQRAAASAGRDDFLYLDEVTYYRQPTLANGWEAHGADQPRTERSYQSNTTTRIVATLDAVTGQVQYRQASKVGVAALVGFYQQVREAYPKAERIWVAQDNWPVHFHGDLLAALEPQPCWWPHYGPAAWPWEPSAKALRRWEERRLPIHLVALPTYAPETNPIEKLWRWLEQEVLHLHRHADALETLRAGVRAFLDQFAKPSLALLRYVGLT